MVFLSSCRNTTPMPVQISQPGDVELSCSSIRAEIEDMSNKVKEGDNDQTKQIATNSVFGVVGIFFIVPWFFMDINDAHSIEAKAAKERYKKLQRMYIDKKCVLT